MAFFFVLFFFLFSSSLLLVFSLGPSPLVWLCLFCMVSHREGMASNFGLGVDRWWKGEESMVLDWTELDWTGLVEGGAMGNA